MITSAIPLPGSGSEGFAAGFGGMDNVFKRLIAQKLKEQEMAETAKYHQGSLGIQQGNLDLQRAQEGRLAQLAPFQRKLIQAQVEKAMEDAKFNRMLMGGDENSIARTHDITGQPSTGMPEPWAPQDFGSLQQMFQGKGMFNLSGNQAPGPQAMMQPPAPQAPGAVMPAQVSQDMGGETVLNPGNPKLYGFDKFAGIKGVPGAQTHYQDGNLITRYPSGKMTMQKLGPSAEERAAQKAETAFQSKIAFEEAKNQMKDAEQRKKIVFEAEQDAPKLRQSLDAMKRVKTIIEQNPKLFGHWLQGHDTYSKRTENKNAGAMNTLLNKFVIQVEKEVSSRGSQLALQFAINSKPNFGEKQEVALGKAEETIRELEEAIKKNEELRGGSSATSTSESNSSSTKGELTYNPTTGRLE